jgi:SsrA-binding protein
VAGSTWSPPGSAELAKKSKKRHEPASGDVATNRRARHKFELVEKLEAGIVLRGSEVKSLRTGKAQMADAYAVVDRGEVWLRNLHIPPYEPASRENHEPERPRKLLLHRAEIERLLGKTAERGLTLVPTRIYFKGGLAKVELALARGKEGRDRRREITERDVRREVEREFKSRMR